MINTDAQKYDILVKKATPSSPHFKNFLLAFVFGGAICTVGELIKTLLKPYITDKLELASWVTMAMIFLGALLTIIGVYDSLAKHAGAGTLVPITGFANAVVSPALDFKAEGYVLGMAVKMFTIAGPVIVYGIVGSVIYGLIVYIFRL